MKNQLMEELKYLTFTENKIPKKAFVKNSPYINKT